jgi:hypothetical protein
MAGYDDVMQRAADYQGMYGGNDFQCMKTKDPNDPRLGKIFKVRNIEPDNKGNLWAQFNDGLRIRVEILNDTYSMISEQAPALRPDQVRASQLNSIPKASAFIADGSMGTLDQTQVAKATQIVSQPDLVPSSTLNIFAGLGGGSQNASVNTPVQVTAQPTSSSNLAKDLFGMFSLSATDLEFSVPVDLPKLDLIQMMYDQASDKEEFLTKFSTYVMQNITLNSVKASMTGLLIPKPKKIRAPKD